MCGLPVAVATEGERFRKMVVVYFCDLVGSTSLGERHDPEVLRRIMDLYFEVVASALYQHGGAIEKYIGDAVLAVFGVPVSHEDDVARALRAAMQIRAQLGDLNDRLEREYGVRLANRTGIHCGEVIVSLRSDGDFLVTGDPVNTAARLEQAAGENECLVSESVELLARGMALLEPVPALRAKGKAEPLPAWRLTGLAAPGQTATSATAPLIGRAGELDALLREYQIARALHQARFVILRGPAGIGKSRLLRELAARAQDAEVLVGHCASYGKGAAFAPLAEMTEQVGGPRWHDALSSLICDGALIARTIAVAAGRAQGSTSEQELIWAFRRLLEEIGKRPLIVAWEDFDRAEPSLLRLVGALGDQLEAAALFVLLARGPLEAVESRAGSRTISLCPLSPEQSAELAAALQLKVAPRVAASPEILDEVARVSEGVPLYIEQLLASVEAGVRGGRGLQVPMSIQAMIESQLDRLDGTERGALHRAAVIGREFRADCLAAISAAESREVLPAVLERLSGRKLVARANQARLGPGTYRFSQPLMREATYRTIPKEHRADWHLAVARWLDDLGNALASDRTAMAGDHLASAAELMAEISGSAELIRSLRKRAGERFASAARQTIARGDISGAVPLLERAAELTPPATPLFREVALRLADCHFQLTGSERARLALREAVARNPGDQDMELLADVQLAILDVQSDPRSRAAAAMIAEAALARFSASGDNVGLCRSHQLRAYLRAAAGQRSAAVSDLRAAAAFVRASGDEPAALQLLASCSEMEVWSEALVSGAIARCQEVLSQSGMDRVRGLSAMASLSVLSAFNGDFVTARATSAAAREIAGQLRLDRAQAALAMHAGLVELYAEDYGTAAAIAESGVAYFEAVGEELPAHTLKLLLARAWLEAGRMADAAAVLHELDSDGRELGRAVRLLAMQLRARLDAADGHVAEAECQAEECVAETSRTDDLIAQAESLLALAEIRSRAGYFDRAAQDALAAAALYRRKGARYLAARAEERAVRLWPGGTDAASEPVPGPGR
jgi:class 3 adenylate cyclase